MKVIDYLSSQLQQLGVPHTYYKRIMDMCIEAMKKGKREVYFDTRHGNILYKFEIIFKVRKEQKIKKHKIDIYEVDTRKSIIY